MSAGTHLARVYLRIMYYEVTSKDYHLTSDKSSFFLRKFIH